MNTPSKISLKLTQQFDAIKEYSIGLHQDDAVDLAAMLTSKAADLTKFAKELKTQVAIDAGLEDGEEAIGGVFKLLLTIKASPSKFDRQGLLRDHKSIHDLYWQQSFNTTRSITFKPA